MPGLAIALDHSGVVKMLMWNPRFRHEAFGVDAVSCYRTVAIEGCVTQEFRRAERAGGAHPFTAEHRANGHGENLDVKPE